MSKPLFYGFYFYSQATSDWSRDNHALKSVAVGFGLILAFAVPLIYGGEEFLVVLPECACADAQRVLDDIRQRFANLRFSYDGQNFACSVSAGHSTSRHAVADGEANEALAAAGDADLLAAADAALYAAKRGGRNRVCAAALQTSTAAVPA